MWGKAFVVCVLVVLFSVGAGIDQTRAAGKHREIEKAGRYRGTIVKLQTVRCSSELGDKRYCKRVYLAMGSEAPLTCRLHLYSEIVRKKKVLYPGPDENKSAVEQMNDLDRLVSKLLRPNTTVSLSVSCDDGGCLIDRIDLR